MYGKRMYEMDERELEEFIATQERAVAKLNYERPGSSTEDVEAGVLKDAKELLAEKRKKAFLSDKPHF
jgi:hypothetical protein